MKKKLLEKDDWLAAFNQGNNDAFRTIFESYNKILFSSTMQLVKDKEQAEDIVSEAFTKLWQRHENFQTEDHIKAFLFVATRNASLNYLRHIQRRTASQSELSYLQKDKDDQDIITDIIEGELLRKIYPLIETLPNKCKTIFKLIYFEDASTDEVAEKLHITPRNVLNQKRRAIQLLKKRLLVAVFISLCLNGSIAFKVRSEHIAENITAFLHIL
ncbi:MULTISPECIES: RNA polymerase sigma-70 factor [Niastella]|uniref:RNA polymerase sigma-70 factor n=1 Tax=Niastella soli TaxID=2821487 RepID=A0ABS3YSY2_9BACT|nr:RNA polymerase sigma-70 factor [Niastella soli]MBO9200973.1 RNA polymerase sigma-70 factor [Niastella soli]